MFRHSSRIDYENAIKEKLVMSLLGSGSYSDEEYEELVDEYINFCEVSGSV